MHNFVGPIGLDHFTGALASTVCPEIWAFIATLMESDVEFIAIDNPHANKLTIHILNHHGSSPGSAGEAAEVCHFRKSIDETPNRKPPSSRRRVPLMDDYESLSHSKWECKYHVVFIPKCRRKTLYAELRSGKLAKETAWAGHGRRPYCHLSGRTTMALGRLSPVLRGGFQW